MNVKRLGDGDGQLAATQLAPVFTGRVIDDAALSSALRDPNFVLLMATLDGAAVGYLHGAFIHRVDGSLMLLIYDLEVAEANRRSGVGTALVKEARRIAKTREATETWLVTEADNSAAVALYESLGGEEFPAVGYEWAEQ